MCNEIERNKCLKMKTTCFTYNTYPHAFLQIYVILFTLILIKFIKLGRNCTVYLLIMYMRTDKDAILHC